MMGNCSFATNDDVVALGFSKVLVPISTTFYKKTHNNLINSIKSILDSLYHTDITKILQLIY